MGSDNGKLNRRKTRFGQLKAESQSDGFRQWKAGSHGVPGLDNGKPKSTESTEGALNPIFKPGGKSSYLRVSCYFDVNYVKHNLHQSGGKLLTLDFCPSKKADDDQCSTLEISRILLVPICCSSRFLKKDFNLSYF